MSFFNNILNNIFKKENIDSGKLQSKVVYNTRNNLMILVSYSQNNFYQVIEFLQAISSISCIRAYLAHSAKEKELTNEQMQEFDKKKVEIIDNRYYLLLAGSPEAYCKIFERIYDLSNEILEAITNDIYNYCSSSYFKEMIDYGILELHKFRFQNIVPSNYDSFVAYKVQDYNEYIYADDIKTIIDKLPEAFAVIDICPAFNIYTTEDDKHYTTMCNFPKLIEKASEIYNGGENSNINRYYEAIAKSMRQAFKLIVPDPSVEVLSIINSPIFLRENLEEMITGNLSVEEMDEIFQQEYDRFAQPTAEYVGDYEDIDEQIGDNEETENMRKEDIIDDSSESV